MFTGGGSTNSSKSSMSAKINEDGIHRNLYVGSMKIRYFVSNVGNSHAFKMGIIV